jgi:hypothetical protein
MKSRSIAIAVVAVLATSAAFAGAPALKVAAPQPAPRAQTLLEDVAAGMREVLRAVTPEISLPAVELKLPTLDPRR